MTRRPRNINEVESARLQSRAIIAGIELPPGYELLVTDSRVGRSRELSRTCTVPLWAAGPTGEDFTGATNADFELYYAAHEAAHAWNYHHDTNDHHGPKFYAHFKRLCPPELWHHELHYKKSNAKRAGIDPDPKRNIVSALPNMVTAVRQDVDRMVAAGPAQDDSKYDDYVNNNPTLKTALTKNNIPDHERKSFIRGWAKHDK